MALLLAREPDVHYPPHDIRTMTEHTLTTTAELVRLLDTRLELDCSQVAQLLCHLAGLGDPCGLDYRMDGATGAMLATLPDYHNPAAAQLGALRVYGPGSGDHVAHVYQPDPHDPLMFSHGQERGPLLVRDSIERRYHRPPAVFLSIAHL